MQVVVARSGYDVSSLSDCGLRYTANTEQTRRSSGGSAGGSDYKIQIPVIKKTFIHNIMKVIDNFLEQDKFNLEIRSYK